MKFIMLLAQVLSFAASADGGTQSHDLLTSSLGKFNEKKFDSAEEIQQVSSWLHGLPTVQLSTLQSDNNLGDDEYELSFNVPFKSPARRNLDEQLRLITEAHKAVVDKKRALFISGLLRETIWNYRVAEKQQAVEQSKLDWLNKQRTLLAQLQLSGNSNLDLLLVENQIIEAELSIMAFKQEAQSRLQQFQNISGESTIPEWFYEDEVVAAATLLNRHPTVEQLQLTLQQSSIKHQLAGKASHPINLAMSATEITTNGVNDRQYGLAVEVPIGLRKNTSQSDQSTWQIEQNELSDQLMNFEQLFTNEITQLKSEHRFLLEKQKLLQQQSDKTKQIFSQLEQLRNNNELNRDLFYQRMVNLISISHQAELNQLYINQNQSRQQQLAGVSL